MKNAAHADPYGNWDVIADASWSKRWTSFDQKQRDEYMSNVALFRTLTIAQMEQLIQGFPPEPYAWMPTDTVLAESIGVVDRLKSDIDRGVLSPAPSVSEFAVWCDAMGVELPTPLVDALAKGVKPSPLPQPQSTKKIILPAWVPLSPIKDESVAPAKNLRGRPRISISTHTYDDLVREGSRILMAAARDGEKLTLAEIVIQLQRTFSESGMTKENIMRRIKGKLPVTQARATAMRNMLAKSKKN